MFVIAHLSDPHLGPIPEARISALLGKRFFGMMNWIGARRRNFGQATLAPLMADLLAQQPDHICVTGDLVNVSLPAEFDTGATFLAALGDAQNVSVVPGNHDAYVRSAMHYHLEHWAPFLAGDDSHPHTPVDVDAFPYVRRRGPVAVVGVSTAVPTAVFLASGDEERIACRASVGGVADRQGATAALDEIQLVLCMRRLTVALIGCERLDTHAAVCECAHERLTGRPGGGGGARQLRQQGIEVRLHRARCSTASTGKPAAFHAVKPPAMCATRVSPIS